MRDGDWFDCIETPEKYELPIYEVALFTGTSNPISGSKVWDKSNS